MVTIAGMQVRVVVDGCDVVLTEPTIEEGEPSSIVWNVDVYEPWPSRWLGSMNWHASSQTVTCRTNPTRSWSSAFVACVEDALRNILSRERKGSEAP